MIRIMIENKFKSIIIRSKNLRRYNLIGSLVKRTALYSVNSFRMRSTPRVQQRKPIKQMHVQLYRLRTVAIAFFPIKISGRLVSRDTARQLPVLCPSPAALKNSSLLKFPIKGFFLLTRIT